MQRIAPIDALQAELVEHIGGKPSPAQAVCIDRCCWLSLRLAQLDERLATNGLTDDDSAAYLAWSNSLTRTLRALGLKNSAPTENSVSTHLARAVVQAGKAVG